MPPFGIPALERRLTKREKCPMTYASPCLEASPRRSLVELELELLGRRLDLLIRQANLKAETIIVSRELEAIERRLEMVTSAR